MQHDIDVTPSLHSVNRMQRFERMVREAFSAADLLEEDDINVLVIPLLNLTQPHWALTAIPFMGTLIVPDLSLPLRDEPEQLRPEVFDRRMYIMTLHHIDLSLLPLTEQRRLFVYDQRADVFITHPHNIGQLRYACRVADLPEELSNE